MMAGLIFVAVIILSSRVLSLPLVAVDKCCPDGESFHLESRQCQTNKADSNPFVQIYGKDDGHSIAVNITKKDNKLPTCPGNWEQFSIQEVNHEVFNYTRYGVRCTNACDQYGEEYFWCRTADSWDYCSVDSKHSIHNQRCANACAKEMNTDYYWCDIDDTDNCTRHDQWDYCSPEEQPEAWITLDGQLVTSKYQQGFFIGKEFCLDKVISEDDSIDIVVLACNPCKGDGKGNAVCINVCCPHGYKVKLNELNEECIIAHEDIDWNPKFELELERNKDYVLTAGKKGNEMFSCQEKAAPIFAEEDIANFTLQINGNLKGEYKPFADECHVDEEQIRPSFCDQPEIKVFEPNQYCLYYGQSESYYYDDYYDDYNYNTNSTNNEVSKIAINETAKFTNTKSTDMHAEDIFTYSICQKQETHATIISTNSFRVWAHSISAFFLLLTLAAYIIDDNLRNALFGRITMAFVSILCIFYTMVVFYYSGFLESSSRYLSYTCILFGYIYQYTFLSFHFWISAMSFNIYARFSRTSSFQQKNGSFSKYLAYAQGGPFIICFITYMIDKFGWEASCPKEHDYLFPNMGVYTCFLGYHLCDTNSDKSYFETPTFIYFHSFLLLFQITNMIFFTLTVYHLSKHWKNACNLTTSKADTGMSNFFVVLKLFLVMGTTWLFDFISTILEHSYRCSDSEEEVKKIYYASLLIDLPNLFLGLLIFLALVCKRKTLETLREKVFSCFGPENLSLSRTKTLTLQSTENVPLHNIPRRLPGPDLKIN